MGKWCVDWSKWCTNWLDKALTETLWRYNTE